MKLPKKLSNQVKKKKSTENDDLKSGIRHLGVIVEHIDGKVSLVAEQYGDIKKDINDIKNTLNSHTETLNSHTETLNSHTETLNSHTETLNSHTEMIGRLNIDVTIIKEDVEFIKSSLKKKIDIDEFSALERRVALLEKRR